jgi:hypothetical protein
MSLRAVCYRERGLRVDHLSTQFPARSYKAATKSSEWLGARPQGREKLHQ